MQHQNQNNFQLLVRPTPYLSEGPLGYLHRLANSNFMNIVDLMNTGVCYHYPTLVSHGLLPENPIYPELHEQVEYLSDLYAKQKRIWNQQIARYCPECLSNELQWRAEWELYFYDVCHIHKVWLIDQCTSCKNKLKWNRHDLFRCDCGSDLCSESTQNAPQNMVIMSSHMSGKLIPKEQIRNELLDDLNIDQLQRLIRYFGNYMNPVYEIKPLKMRGSSDLVNSWTVTSVAAEIIADWPGAFYKALNRLQTESSKVSNPSLNKVFGQAYHYIYKGLKEASYKPLRNAFEHWISQSWKGGVAKRNKRLANLLLVKAQWVPGNLACEKLGISSQRLELLMREGLIYGEIYYSQKGRKYIMVRQDNLQVLRANIQGEIDMINTGELLGLNKKRMRQILRYLFPQARKSGNSGSSPWCISRHAVNVLLEIGVDQPIQAIPDEDCVSLSHILRYWANSSDEIVAVINAVKEKELPIVANLEGVRGIAAWIFEEQRLRAWLHKYRSGNSTWMTITQAAKLIGVKEEVGYDMVKFGFIESEVMPNQAKGGTRVKSAIINDFKSKYIFGTQISDRMGVSPRKAISILDKLGIQPISGPSVDGGRQVLYLKTQEVDQLIAELECHPKQ